MDNNNNNNTARDRINAYYMKYYKSEEIKAAEERFLKYKKWFNEGHSVPGNLCQPELNRLLNKREKQKNKCVEILDKMEDLNLSFNQVSAILFPRAPDFCFQALLYALKLSNSATVEEQEK